MEVLTHMPGLSSGEVCPSWLRLLRLPRSPGFPRLLSAAVTSITLGMTALLHLFPEISDGCWMLQLAASALSSLQDEREREREREEGGSHLFNV